MLVESMGYDIAGSTDNSDTAFAEINQLKPDLLLVDINISGTMDGIELLTKVREHSSVPAIFITSFTDDKTFQRAKQVVPKAYISKPIQESELQRAIELAFIQMDPVNPSDESWSNDKIFKDAIFIKNRNRLDKVDIDEILYLEVEDRYSTVFTEDGKKYVLRMSMGQVQEKLSEDIFIRVHRKFSVNLNKIKSIDLQDNLILVGNTNIPVSRSHKESLIQKLPWMQ